MTVVSADDGVLSSVRLILGGTGNGTLIVALLSEVVSSSVISSLEEGLTPLPEFLDFLTCSCFLCLARRFLNQTYVM